MKAICACGKEFDTYDYLLKRGRGKYCCKKCMYENMSRPKGLIYKKHKENPTSFKKGNKPWNTGLKGLGICKAPPMAIKKGEHRSVYTEFTTYSSIGSSNAKWKGDSVGYFGLHTWIRRRLGDEKRCQECGTDKYKRYHYHNIDGLYKRNLIDWILLCPKCHKQKHLKNK
jgi:hypothetical protein